MDKRKVPHLALVAGWGTFFVPFSGCLGGCFLSLCWSVAARDCFVCDFSEHVPFL